MDAQRPAIEVQDWQPPEAPEPRQGWRERAALDRGVVIGVVIAMHVAAALLFALPTMQRGVSPAAGASPMAVTFIELPSAVAEPNELALPVSAMEVSLDPPSPSMPEPVATAEEVDLPDSIEQFRPPRMLPDEGKSLAELTTAAGLVVARQTRVILTVDVQENGSTGKVEIAVTSGDENLDALAVEYARAMRWIPAVVQGRQSSMSIRLPVIIPTTG
jgi:TonB family protein